MSNGGASKILGVIFHQTNKYGAYCGLCLSWAYTNSPHQFFQLFFYLPGFSPWCISEKAHLIVFYALLNYDYFWNIPHKSYEAPTWFTIIILCQFSFSNILRDCTWLTLYMNSSRLIVFLDIIFVYLSVILTSFCQNYQNLLFWLNYDIRWFAQKVHTFFLKVFHCNSRSYRGVICPMI